MGTQLETVKYSCESLIEKLAPLLRGVPVVFTVNEVSLSFKSRVGEHPLLFLTPSSVYGIDSDAVVVSLHGFGCEVVDVHNPRPLPLALMGLPWSLSKALCDGLLKLFENTEVKNAKC